MVNKKWTATLESLCISSVLALGSGKVDATLKRSTPGSLRAAAATQDFMRNQSVDRAQWRGRWASVAVLKHYLQMGVYHLSAVNLPVESHEPVRETSERFNFLCGELLTL